MEKIFIHLPAYREPELIPTIESALKNAEHPDRLVFGICRQYNPEDGFDNLDKYENNPQFKIYHLHYEKAKGLAYARALINEELLDEEEFVLQLDSHHRFDTNFDTRLISWYNELKEEGSNPLICGYLPYYDPFDDPSARVQEPWFSEPASFYPHGTIFIRPTAFKDDWTKFTKPVPARFISGHFCFGPNKWAKDIKHDTDIYFAGEELNLTIRSFTHGYDLFHPHELIIWHATMRTEREGILAWDDNGKKGDNKWMEQTKRARAKIRQLLRVEDNGFDLTGYDIGKVRTIRDYERYAGIHFKKKSVQKYTQERSLPPNPVILDDKEWEDSFMFSFYFLVDVHSHMLPEKDYDFILIAFDDENGNPIETETIEGPRLKQYLYDNRPIHYEKMFLTDVAPTRVVYWAHSPDRGWAERHEILL